MEPLEQVHTFNEYKPKKNRLYQRHEDTNKNDDEDNSRNVVSSYRAKIDGMIINIINLEMRIQMILL